ncbi:MAG: phosphoribosyl-ATP diphosphatase [Rhodospirillales bacterium]
MDRLYDVVMGRRGGDVEKSYSAKLFSRGRGKICQKLGEEAVETIVAALDEKPANVASESADLLYHLVMLWAETGVNPDQVWAELEGRLGTSGLDEKKGRKNSKFGKSK